MFAPKRNHTTTPKGPADHERRVKPRGVRTSRNHPVPDPGAPIEPEAVSDSQTTLQAPTAEAPVPDVAPVARIARPSTELKPNPAPIPARPFRDITEERQVFCKLYDGCLSQASHNGWDDFTCRRCPLAHLATAPSATTYATARKPNE